MEPTRKELDLRTLRVGIEDERYRELERRARMRGMRVTTYVRLILYQMLNQAQPTTTSSSNVP